MHLPRKTRRRRRPGSCPPNLKLCRDPGAQPSGHTMASDPSFDTAHSREGPNKHLRRNAPVSRIPVDRPDGTGQYPRANDGLPCFRSHSRAHRRILGVGPYWNPPPTAPTTAPATTTWAKGPKMTDCHWMRTDDDDDAAAAAVTENTDSTTANERKHDETTDPTTECEDPEWDQTPPKRQRPCPREAWPSFSDDSMSQVPSQYVRRTATDADKPRDGEPCTALVRYCAPHEYRVPLRESPETVVVPYRRLSDSSLLSSSYSSSGHSDRELATWDPFWIYGSSVDHADG